VRRETYERDDVEGFADDHSIEDSEVSEVRLPAPMAFPTSAKSRHSAD
jgi:hypothetical protein